MRNLGCQQWIVTDEGATSGNPSLAPSLATYMFSLQRRKVSNWAHFLCCCADPTFQRLDLVRLWQVHEQSHMTSWKSSMNTTRHMGKSILLIPSQNVVTQQIGAILMCTACSIVAISQCSGASSSMMRLCTWSFIRWSWIGMSMGLFSSKFSSTIAKHIRMAVRTQVYQHQDRLNWTSSL